MTKNARLILGIIEESREHLTADQIYTKLEGTPERVSMATVYNSLNALCAEGLIRRLVFEGQSDRYDRLDRHDHMVCRRCGAVNDVSFEDMTKRLGKACGCEIDGYDLNIYYICDGCRSKNDK